MRSTIDMLIATFCVANDHRLLHADRDLATIAEHLNLATL